MRRLFLIALLVPAIATGGAVLVGANPAAGQLPGDDPGRGLVHAGLRAGGPNSRCAGNFEVGGPGVAGLQACTHGPDPAPAGLDVRRHREPAETQTPSGSLVTPAATTGIQCYGDGVSGNRVQAIYAHAPTVASRYAEYATTFAQAAATADTNINASAAETGGVRHVRFVTDASCNLVILDVTLSAGADASLDTMRTDLINKGYNRSDRKYLVWVDANKYCGIGDLFVDDSPGPTNDNNGVQAQFARIDNGCWNLAGQSVETHELSHTLGSVQPTAPHHTAGYHCTDESDRMCYDDGSGGVVLSQVCPTFHEQRVDCRHDDYFSTAPGPGNYLATHWNTANSSFLSATGPAWVVPRPVPADFDGNATTNPSVFRPSGGTWFWQTSGGSSAVNWGTNGDIPVPGDYDGDKRTDAAVFRPSSGTWFIRPSGTGGTFSVAWGASTDVPVAADYDDDGVTDIAVFRPSSGVWFIKLSGAGVDTATPYGASGDVPVPDDYDGDGRADIAVFRPSSGVWFVNLSGGGESTVAYGTSGDVPVPGDYDGDHRADRAVFRPSSGVWFVNLSGGGASAVAYGTSGDVPVPGDYGGDGKTDLAVFRPAVGVWFIKNPGALDTVTAWGTSTDIPLPLPPAIRNAAFG